MHTKQLKERIISSSKFGVTAPPKNCFATKARLSAGPKGVIFDLTKEKDCQTKQGRNDALSRVMLFCRGQMFVVARCAAVQL